MSNHPATNLAFAVKRGQGSPKWHGFPRLVPHRSALGASENKDNPPSCGGYTGPRIVAGDRHVGNVLRCWWCRQGRRANIISGSGR